MSISVKSISVSINGVQSEKFKIEIEGAKYRLDNFVLRQRLMEPCMLTFNLRKDPEEDISEVQFSACSTIIGKDVTMTMQTDSMELSMSGFSDSGKNAQVEFEGFVTSAHASRFESEYIIQVEALSKDAALIDHPDCHVYNEYKLADIVNEVLKRGDVKAEVEPKYEEQIFYTGQYNENSYAFLRRLAQRYGEWMFCNGKQMHFGKLSEQESIQLKYPSQDLPEYSVSLQTRHQSFKMAAAAYNELTTGTSYDGTDQEDTGNKLNDSVFSASKEIYPNETRMMMDAASLETDDKAEGGSLEAPDFIEQAKAERQGTRANMLVYFGTTYCSKMKIGCKLTIMDNYISSSAEKSQVQQDEILITEVTHTFGVDDEYRNSFRGIAGSIDYPPYLNPYIFPHCDHPLRAHVVDTEDPKHWGRVKVRFPFQVKEYQDKDKNGTTPWIHVTQQFSSFDKHGTHVIPEIFTQVYVDFEEGNFERPYVCGTHHSVKLPVDEEWYPGNNKVKAIRTSSGHTIEIHDVIEGEEDEKEYKDGGYIKVYDSHTQIYEILLSTDKKLISMNCKGDIDIHADGNISMSAGENITADAGASISNKAKQHVSNSAGGDFNAGAGGTFNGSAGSEVLINAGTNFSAKAGEKLDLTSIDEMKIHSASTLDLDSSKEMTIAAEKDMSVMAHKAYSITVEDDATATVNRNLNITVMSNAEANITNGLTIKAMNITEQAMNGFKEYSMTHEVNATMKLTLQATATIELSAPFIKEN